MLERMRMSTQFIFNRHENCHDVRRETWRVAGASNEICLAAFCRSASERPWKERGRGYRSRLLQPAGGHNDWSLFFCLLLLPAPSLWPHMANILRVETVIKAPWTVSLYYTFLPLLDVRDWVRPDVRVVPQIQIQTVCSQTMADVERAAQVILIRRSVFSF